jgi:hypothetical protein
LYHVCDKGLCPVVALAGNLLCKAREMDVCSDDVQPPVPLPLADARAGQVLHVTLGHCRLAHRCSSCAGLVSRPDAAWSPKLYLIR